MPVRFGPFEIDTTSAEVRKHGVRLQLQDQPFRVLTTLLERPGQLVSREELIGRLWPGGTHVDFERGLNAAVARLRQVLSDSPEHSRYIETVPKRGYRFIGFEAAPEIPAPPPAAHHQPPRWIWAAAGMAVLAVVAALGVETRDRVRELQPPLVPLTSYVGYESRPALSPDGKHVAFDWDEQPAEPRVYVKLIGDGDPVRLTSAEANEVNPVWSPDGRHIAFLRFDSPGRISVYVTPVLGGVERKLFEYAAPLDFRSTSTSHSALLAWAPDGLHLVATVPGEHHGCTGLALIPTEGGESRWLLSPPNKSFSGDMQPSFSPDGRTLAFVRRVARPSGDVYLASYSAAENRVSDPRRLTKVERVIGGISWMPDGKTLVFSAGNSLTQFLYQIGTTPGEEPVPLRGFGDAARQPHISRAGTLVFSRRTDNPDVFRQEIPAPGATPNAPERLIGSTQLDGDAQYSPDGSRIAFRSTRSGAFQIWTCAADGTRCAQATHEFSGQVLGPPSWSPDGRLIAFDSAERGNFEIYVVGASGGRSKRLTFDPADDSMPVFSPDGQNIFFTSSRSGAEEIWRMPASGGHPVQVTRGGAYKGLVSGDGKWLYFGRIEAPGFGIWRKALDGDGAETKMASGVSTHSWALSTDRLWYLVPYKEAGELRFLDLKTGKTVEVAKVPRPERMAVPLSVSPDARYVLVSENVSRGADLMLTDSFR